MLLLVENTKVREKHEEKGTTDLIYPLHFTIDQANRGFAHIRVPVWPLLREIGK